MLPQRKTNRLANFDYSQPNHYFVTFGTYQQQCWFGKINNGKFTPNKAGEIALDEWESLKRHYTFIHIHGFVLMPNHIHAIIEILENNNDYRSLSQIIARYKTSVSRVLHQTCLPQFKWHRSFHDHIIRNPQTLEKIKKYIQDNPLNWQSTSYGHGVPCPGKPHSQIPLYLHDHSSPKNSQ